MPKTAMEMVSYMLQRECDACSSRAATWNNVGPQTLADIRWCAGYAGFASKVNVNFANGSVRVIR